MRKTAEQIKAIRRIVTRRLEAEHQRQKLIHDAKHRQQQFLPDQLVLVRKPTREPGMPRKFSLKWRGPYRVTRQLENMPSTYEAEIEKNGKMVRETVNGLNMRRYYGRRLIDAQLLPDDCKASGEDTSESACGGSREPLQLLLEEVQVEEDNANPDHPSDSSEGSEADTSDDSDYSIQFSDDEEELFHSLQSDSEQESEPQSLVKVVVDTGVTKTARKQSRSRETESDQNHQDAGDTEHQQPEPHEEVQTTRSGRIVKKVVRFADN